jgi:hypothetical protein
MPSTPIGLSIPPRSATSPIRAFGLSVEQPTRLPPAVIREDAAQDQRLMMPLDEADDVRRSTGWR